MDLQKELDRCAKCGQCRSVCPVFLALKDETLVARGRLAIIQAVQQTNSPAGQLKRILDTCLMCRRCEENCPSLVDTSAVFKSERQRIAQEKGLPLLLKLGFRWVLPNRWLYNLVLRSGSIFMRPVSWVLKTLHAPRSTLYAPSRHLPLYFANIFQRMPRLASKSALKIFNQQSSIGNQPKVSIFIGCAANYIYPEIIEALVSVLDHLKIPYVIPQGQVCCGMPALLSGDIKTSDKLSKINQEIFKTETIITVCPTCNRMLAEEYKLKGIKVMDAMEFLNEASDFVIRPSLSAVSSSSSLDIRSSYHQPCHSAGTKAPEIIKTFLKANTDYKEIDDICCGGGGLFSFKYPELSGLIGKARMDGIERRADNAHANTLHASRSTLNVVTNCPGCIMQLEYLLASGKQGIRVRHILNLIMDAHKTGQPVPHTRK